jgi:hypothetical protein
MKERKTIHPCCEMVKPVGMKEWRPCRCRGDYRYALNGKWYCGIHYERAKRIDYFPREVEQVKGVKI